MSFGRVQTDRNFRRCILAESILVHLTIPQNCSSTFVSILQDTQKRSLRNILIQNSGQFLHKNFINTAGILHCIFGVVMPVIASWLPECITHFRGVLHFQDYSNPADKATKWKSTVTSSSLLQQQEHIKVAEM